MTVASLIYPLRSHTWQAPKLFHDLREQWSRDPQLWRSIATGLGFAVLGFAMAGSAFGVLAR